MTGLRDTLTLSLTKLRTRKIRLAVTIIVSGLLFSGLAAASLVTRGVFQSFNEFSKEGLGERYIVQSNSMSNPDYFSNEEIIRRAQEIHKNTTNRKQAEAKRLGIEYNAATDPAPVNEFDTPGGKQRNLNPDHPAAKAAIKEYQTTKPPVGIDVLKSSAGRYGAQAYYESKMLAYNLEGSVLQVLKGGKETYGNEQQENMYGPPSGTDSFVQSWSLISGELMQPFILPGENLASTDGSIPIIVPYSAAEQILGLKPLSGAKPAEKLARTKEVREKAKGTVFDVCYRNQESNSLINSAIETQKEIEANKNKKDYQRPSLIYGLPKEACGPAVITRDVRTVDEKTNANKQEEFDKIFGKEPAEQSKINFRIVGVVPDPSYSMSAGVAQIISSLVTSSLGSGWYTPLEQLEKNLIIAKLFPQEASNYGIMPSYYAEFSDANGARDFLDKENCQPDFSASFNKDPYLSCVEAGKPFTSIAYGSNSLAIESAKRSFGKFFRIIALVIAGIASIIMMGTVGRMIADSRRETAVFRAIGAKKLDIAQIYVLYTTMLSLLIFAFSVGLGLVFASYVHSRYADEATVQALVAYNAQDLTKDFNLYGFYAPDMLLLLGLSLAGGLLSAILPLIRNLRRNPIRDMRDDT